MTRQKNSLSRVASHLFMALSLLSGSVLLTPQWTGATEEYARQTGLACAVCHFDPAGGGELTSFGKDFSDRRQAPAERPSAGKGSWLFRLTIGYIHFLTAIFWFGTILYVHLVLKPAYAASGLPRNEVRVGITSMIVMGVTGAILTCYRVTTFDTLVHTRFGMLLSIKVCLYLVMVLSAMFVVTVIGPRLKVKLKEPSIPDTNGELTHEELATFDGKDGRPAYFVVEGKVYDATHSKLWQQGVHMGRHTAGNDLTEALKQAPHGPEKVTVMASAGVLTAAGPRPAPLRERVFFFMAYMNLIIVFMIILILSLWRWG